MSSVLRTIVMAVVDEAVANGASRPELEALAGTDERIPIERLYALWERAVDATGLRGLPIRVGARAGFDRYGALGIAFYVSGDHATALRRLCRHHDLLTDSGTWDSRIEGDDLIVRWHRTGDPRPGLELANEQVLAAFVAVLRQMSDAVELRELRLQHRAPACEDHRAHFAVPIRSDAGEDAVVLSKAILDTRPRASDPAIEQFLVAQIEAASAHASADDLVRQVSRAIVELLPDGVPTVDDIAPRLATSERTLRRKLTAAGTSFDQLLTGLQRERALVLLAGSYPIGEIALAVGFADAAGFSRAFKRWTDRTPSDVRKQLS
jgi:AraC-like DNA-binding protein